jgi:hypothetical protein
MRFWVLSVKLVQEKLLLTSCRLLPIEETRVMVFNATFNDISVISWLSVLLVDETGVSRENHRSAASH